MAAAIYARYSSENQRPESIDDQVSACRKLAKLRWARELLTVLARSGAPLVLWRSDGTTVPYERETGPSTQ